MLHMNRRNFLCLAAALTPLAVPARADDDASSVVAFLKDGQLNEITLGKKILPPDDPAWNDAFKILDAAPTGTVPFRVALYFKENVPSRFQEAWPESDANPVIVKFFYDLKQTPAGDTTPWCAAFVNWCLSRSAIKGTNSAASQSFIDQKWGNEIWKAGDGTPSVAKQGDIVVFKHRSNPAKGHVAFFNRMDPRQSGHIEVLGGNQLKKVGGTIIHLIDYASMPIESDLQLYSIRTRDGLR
jgi:uncharacterized protein (TIGR02594 family)